MNDFQYRDHLLQTAKNILNYNNMSAIKELARKEKIDSMEQDHLEDQYFNEEL